MDQQRCTMQPALPSPQNKSLFAQKGFALGKQPSKLVAKQIARLQLNQTCLALTAANDAGANISK